jgi:hypothetical protein
MNKRRRYLAKRRRALRKHWAHRATLIVVSDELIRASEVDVQALVTKWADGKA